jgi:hypothetical protein
MRRHYRPEGYHPVVKAPGAYYLNFLAGDVRRHLGRNRSGVRLDLVQLGREPHFRSNCNQLTRMDLE